MIFRQLPEAETEIEEALAWYAERSPDAAVNLLGALRDARLHISAFPLAASRISGMLFRFVLHKYPYDLVYRLGAHEIVVVALAHHSRRPGYWKGRLEELT